jgi:hypothetical protein
VPPRALSDVGAADRGYCLYAVVACGGVEGVAAGGADAEDAYPVGVDLLTGGHIGHRCLDVFYTVSGVLQTAGHAFRLALAGRVEGERHEAVLGKLAHVEAGGLFFHAAAGVADYDCRRVACFFGNVEMGGQGMPALSNGVASTEADACTRPCSSRM